MSIFAMRRKHHKRLDVEADAAAERSRRQTEARLQREIMFMKDAEAEKPLSELRVDDAVARASIAQAAVVCFVL
jgi:hypothetical protein